MIPPSTPGFEPNAQTKEEAPNFQFLERIELMLREAPGNWFNLI
jgi:hypothetical protein